MTQSTSPITAGDYECAGMASKALKEQLKRIGAAPQIVRRVMIAAYEAEMNVVIHGGGGLMRWSVEDDQVAVEVVDEGPGIPDIDLAMTEGHSTAPANARALGFGAGMGLPNIRRNTDRFSIESTVGCGTRVRFSIRLHPAEMAAHRPNSLSIEPGSCTRCLQCLHACPTAALRVRAAGPIKLDHLCIDCTACIAACSAGALTPKATGRLAASADAVLVLQPVFLTQIGFSVEQATDIVREAGFAKVLVTGPAEQALARAAQAYAQENADGPVISPVCPAVLNLIETRFPALIGYVAPFLSPLEAVREELIGRRATFLVLCPSQQTLLSAGRGPARSEAIAPADLASAFQSHLPRAPIALDREPTSHCIAGMANVLQVLEEIENGDRTDGGVLELYACDGGCDGSPLLSCSATPGGHDRMPRTRFAISPCQADTPVRRGEGTHGSKSDIPAAIRRDTMLTARVGLRLDDNMAAAMAKLSRIDRLIRQLPGTNCGLCGSPTCAAFAEDVVLERATMDACSHMEKLCP